MIAFPEMLVAAAEAAGMKIPPDLEGYDPEEFPYWHIFTALQLGRSMPDWNAHWANAKVIAAIPEDQLKTVTRLQLEDLGFA